MAPIKTEDVIATTSNGNSNTIHLGEYIFLRLIQANPKLKTIFGIPGDFNLNLLEHLYSDLISDKLKFIGLCNELNAAYTADGYSRLNGLACLITTFGVGELSAINGIAGAFAEFSPILHIVGTTSTKQIAHTNYVYNHHHLVQSKDPLQPPNHDVYKKMVEDISCAQESLTDDIETNIIKIDYVLNKILSDSRPGYLFIPSNVSDIKVDLNLLNKPLINHSIDIDSLDFFSNAILQKLSKSKNPLILVDCLVARFGFKSELNDFINKLPNLIKLFSSNMGRTIDESLPNFVGCYYGENSTDSRIGEELEKKSDLLINLGYFNGETNNGGYTTDFSNVKDYIEIHPDYILIDEQYHYIKNKKDRLFSLGDLLTSITNKIDSYSFNIDKNNVGYKHLPKNLYKPSKIDQVHIPQTKLIDWLNSYLQPNDLLIIETCSFQFAMPDLVLPPGVDLISQNFYGSIGFAVPATLGATFASNDQGSSRRILLLEGDGSAQMTIQDLSTFLKYHQHCKVMPKIFIINNDGYTVERLIKGPTRPYNDILGSWDWSNLLRTFGDANQVHHKGIKLNNVQEFEEYFANESEDSRLQVFDLITGKFDVPDRFLKLFCQ